MHQDVFIHFFFFTVSISWYECEYLELEINERMIHFHLAMKNETKTIFRYILQMVIFSCLLEGEERREI